MTLLELLLLTHPRRSATGISVSRPPITQAMLYQMGHSAQSSDDRAFRLEAAVPLMIKIAITDALSPLRD